MFITDKQPFNRGPIADSHRRAIPDALIAYPDNEEPVIVVIESKVRAPADETHSRKINLGFPARWDPACPVELKWDKLIDELWVLVEMGLVARVNDNCCSTSSPTSTTATARLARTARSAGAPDTTSVSSGGAALFRRSIP